MDEKEYPSNSKARKSDAPRPEIKSVVTGKVTVKNKTVGDSLKNTVWGRYVKPALIFAGVSIILPAIKDMAEDAVTGMIRGAFNGGEYNRSRGKNGQGYVNYSSFSKSEQKQEPR